MAATIDVNELTPEMRSNLSIRKPRETQFSKDDIRGWSLKVLSVMANLTRAERARVLTHAQRVNKV